jgi:hypothetical protein
MPYRPTEFRSIVVKLYYVKESKEKENKVCITLALARTRPMVLILHRTV